MNESSEKATFKVFDPTVEGENKIENGEGEGEDEEYLPYDELNKNFKADIKSQRTDISYNTPFDHIGYDGGMNK